MAERGDRRIGGITIGGIVVIVGILIMLFVSILLGAIVTIIGLVAFGGFVRGKWYWDAAFSRSWRSLRRVSCSRHRPLQRPTG